MRLSAKITAWHRNYLGLSVYSILGVKIDVMLVLRSQFFEFLRETLYKHALGHLEAAGPEKERSHFFFQAEDGIRDFCLSRGLGDVYKRQVITWV